MGTVTYKKQNAAAKDLKKGVPLTGGKHLYTVNAILWPKEVERYLESMCIGKTLHLCCGKSRLGDYRVDAHETDVDLQCDATKTGIADDSYDTVICDPPYTGQMQWQHDLLSEISRISSRRIVFQHWFIPADHDGLWKKFKQKFRLSGVYVWQPKTYFGRVNVISVFDVAEDYDPSNKGQPNE